MNHGDTFICDLTGPPHLWIVLSDPSQDGGRIVVVSVRTWHQGFPETCCLEAGVHPFLEHRSYVDFRWTQVTSLAKLSGLSKTPKPPMPASVITRILKAADESWDIPSECREIILQQGLVDDL